MLWLLWVPSKESMEGLQRPYAPDLLRVPFYRLLSRFFVWPSVALAVLLFLAGGLAFCGMGHVCSAGVLLSLDLACELCQPSLWVQEFPCPRPVDELLVGSAAGLRRGVAQ
jgi:hypothetical protein